MSTGRGSSDVLLEMRNLGKSYTQSGQQHFVLRQLNATIRRGEFVVIVGRSGSGKSTLLNLIGALDSPSEGCVLFDGADIGALDESARTLFRRRQVGFVFQFFNLIPTLTVLENLRLPAELNGASRAIAEQRSIALLSTIGITGRERAFPEELSGGERQRVAIARALVHDPGLILADEPTGNLDIDTARSVLALLDELCRRGEKTLVMATHSREVMGLADRILTIEHGRLQEQ